MSLNSTRPPLSEMKANNTDVVIVRKGEKFWEVFGPKALYPITYLRWEQAINFAHTMATAYAGQRFQVKSAGQPENMVSRETRNQLNKLMINRKSV